MYEKKNGKYKREEKYVSGKSQVKLKEERLKQKIKHKRKKYRISLMIHRE